MAGEPSDVCPTVAASQCSESLSPEDCQVDSRRTGNQQSNDISPITHGSVHTQVLMLITLSTTYKDHCMSKYKSHKIKKDDKVHDSALTVNVLVAVLFYSRDNNSE